MDDGYRFGQTYEKRIEVKDIDYFSNLFGEGSKSLTELIKYCMLNNIRTFASCKGHPEDKNVIDRISEIGYLAFRIEHIDMFTYFLATLPHIIPGVKSLIDYDPKTCKASISIEVPATKSGVSDEYFEKILKEIIKYRECPEDFLVNSDVKKVVDYILFNPSPVRFYITNKKYIRIDNKRNGVFAFQVHKCPRIEETGKLHAFICNALNKPKNIDELIDYEPKR